jgi:hypothetical protein
MHHARPTFACRLLGPGGDRARGEHGGANHDPSLACPEDTIASRDCRQRPRERLRGGIDIGNDDQARLATAAFDPGQRAAVAPPGGRRDDEDVVVGRAHATSVDQHGAACHLDHVSSAGRDRGRQCLRPSRRLSPPLTLRRSAAGRPRRRSSLRARLRRRQKGGSDRQPQGPFVLLHRFMTPEASRTGKFSNFVGNAPTSEARRPRRPRGPRRCRSPRQIARTVHRPGESRPVAVRGRAGERARWCRAPARLRA